MPEYTTCVLPADYVAPPIPAEGSAGATAEAIFTTLNLLEDTCDYMLHGKLVCLGGDRCAIGHVAGFETVEDKSSPTRLTTTSRSTFYSAVGTWSSLPITGRTRPTSSSLKTRGPAGRDT